MQAPPAPTSAPAGPGQTRGARVERDEAKTALKGIPAELPATDINPQARPARPRLERRSHQRDAWRSRHLL